MRSASHRTLPQTVLPMPARQRDQSAVQLTAERRGKASSTKIHRCSAYSLQALATMTSSWRAFIARASYARMAMLQIGRIQLMASQRGRCWARRSRQTATKMGHSLLPVSKTAFCGQPTRECLGNLPARGSRRCKLPRSWSRRTMQTTQRSLQRTHQGIAISADCGTSWQASNEGIEEEAHDLRVLAVSNSFATDRIVVAGGPRRRALL